jgi:hypothetical protein
VAQNLGLLDGLNRERKQIGPSAIEDASHHIFYDRAEATDHVSLRIIKQMNTVLERFISR